MSLSSVVPYFRTHAIATDLKEWKDAFNTENIPSNLIDKAFHIELGSFTGVRLNQLDQEVDCAVTVRIFVKGFRYPSEGRDRAVSISESYALLVLKASNRLTGDIKQVTLDAINYESFDQSNDNLVVARCEFTARVILPAN